jgi:predicted RNA-binding protein with PIN domain
MAEWVVDGDNVVGSRPDGWWRDRAGAKRRLVERLERFAAARDVPVTVVFDGRAIDAGGGDRVVQPRRPTGRPAILRRSSCFGSPCP